MTLFDRKVTLSGDSSAGACQMCQHLPPRSVPQVHAACVKTPTKREDFTYNAKGQIASETVNQRVSDGSGSFDLLTSNKTYTYYDANGLYAMGQVGQISSVNSKNGVSANAPNTLQRYRYYFFNDQTLSDILYTPNTSVPGTVHSNSSTFDDWGYVRAVQIADGRPRTVRFMHDENGHVLSREEDEANFHRGNPRQIYYRFDGKQLGEISNDGTANITYDEAVAELGAQPPTNELPFRNGASTGREHADFHQHYDAVNSYKASSSSRSSWTVQNGESLRSIAHAVWGDSSLWYKIAEANGMSGDSGLSAGQVLTLPTNVVRTQFNAGTLKAYDPAQALGDLAPTSPVPVEPAAASKKGGGCGIVGKILIAVIAVAVTIVVTAGAAAAISGKAFGTALGALTGTGAAAGGTAGAASIGTGAWIAGGAIGGAVGSAASQGAGIALGIQEKFSWKGVALGAIQGAIGAGVGVNGAFGKDGLFGAGPLAAGARGAVSNAATQGIALATGLQSKFDFAGVAAAGVGAAVGSHVGDNVHSLGRFGGTLAAGAAGAIANAATRSAIDGTSFGDGIIAAIPDVIGQAVGGALAGALGRALPQPEQQVNNNPSKQVIDEVDQWASLDGIENRNAVRQGIAARLEGFASNPNVDPLVLAGARTDPAFQQNLTSAVANQLAGNRDDGPVLDIIETLGGSEARDAAAASLAKVPRLELDYLPVDLSGGAAPEFVAAAVGALVQIHDTVDFINTQIEQNVPFASWGLEAISFATGPVAWVVEKAVMASPLGGIIEEQVGEGAQWLAGQLSSAGIDPTRTFKAAAGGVFVASLAFGAKRALSFFNEAKYALALRVAEPTSFGKMPTSVEGERVLRGTIYRVPGTATSSKKPYIGRHNQPTPQITRSSRDGRDRSQAIVIDRFEAFDTRAGQILEQYHIDRHGGVPALDNKRNEIAKLRAGARR